MEQLNDIANFRSIYPIVNELLNNYLNLKEREILQRRHGLSVIGNNKAGKKETLEQIGKDFGVTRERIRQIENSAIRKLVNNPEVDKKINHLSYRISNIVNKHGGIIEEKHLFEKFWNKEIEDLESSSFYFLLNHLIKNLKKTETEHIHTSWLQVNHNIDYTHKIIECLLSIIEKYSEPLSYEDLLSEALSNNNLAFDDYSLNEDVIYAHLRLSKKIKQDVFGNWGLEHWRIVSPRRMSDKIYLILKKHGRPMHFTEIAEAINKMNFDKKKAHPPTVHNELILDKDRFVLVGRGMYGLVEHGYKHGVVADVIYNVLKEKGPLSKDEILEEVLKQRVVAKSTIYLALTTKKQFKKLEDGRYYLA